MQILQELCAETRLWLPSHWQGVVPLYDLSESDSINVNTDSKSRFESKSAWLHSGVDMATRTLAMKVTLNAWTSFVTTAWHDISQVFVPGMKPDNVTD